MGDAGPDSRRGDSSRARFPMAVETHAWGERQPDAQSVVVAVPYCRRSGLRSSARVHRGRCVGTVFLAEANVAHEASTLTTMYRQTVAMPDPQRTQLRQQLRKYAEAVSGPEWSAQETGGGTSDTARAAISEMYRLFGNRPASTSSPVDGEFLNKLDVLTTDRDQRVLDQKSRIPTLLWAGLIFGGVLLMAVAGFVHLSSRPVHVALVSGVAVLLGLLLFLVYWLDHPFGTEIGVTPAPFHHAVEAFDVMDRGT